MKKSQHQSALSKTLKGIGGALLLTLVYWVLLHTPAESVLVSSQQFLWMHSTLMMFSIVVCACIFIVGWNVLDDSRPKASVLLACAFLAVGLADSAHMLSYQVMPDFVTASGIEKALAFRLMASLIAAVALLMYGWPLANNKKNAEPLFKKSYMAVTLTATCVAGVVIVLSSDVQQLMADVNQCLSPFVYTINAVIITLYLLTLFWLYTHKSKSAEHNRAGLVLAVGLLVASESFFLLSMQTTDSASFLGHIDKAVAFVCSADQYF